MHPRWRLRKFSTYDVCQRALVPNRCWFWFARLCQILAHFVFISWFHDLQMQKITCCSQDSLKTWLVIVVCPIFCWTLPSANWLERKQLLSMRCEFQHMCNKTDAYSCSKSKCVSRYFAEDWVQFCAQQMRLQMLLAGKSIGLHFLMASCVTSTGRTTTV